MTERAQWREVNLRTLVEVLVNYLSPLTYAPDLSLVNQAPAGLTVLADAVMPTLSLSGYYIM